MRDEPEISVDHKKSRKLYLRRNHPRVNQTSMDLLQSWRGNCDIQILIYDSSPSDPNIAEIATVTDYVVAYSCKGNTTFVEENQQNTNFILNAQSENKGKSDVQRVVKQIMNDCAKKRMISKQEAMVMLGGLDLVFCSETISPVSISSSKRLRKAEDKTTDKTFITLYEKRKSDFESFNMYDYFEEIKNKQNENKNQKTIIPNFVGVNGTPTFPVTESYARHVLIVYKPWRKYPRQKEWKRDFEQYINSPNVHPAAYLPYKRAVERYIRKTVYAQPKAENAKASKDGLTEEDQEIIDLYGLQKSDNLDYDTILIKSLPKGENHDWNKPIKVSTESSFVCESLTNK